MLLTAFTGHAFHTFLSLHRRAFRIRGRFPDTTLNVSMLNVREITIRRDTLDGVAHCVPGRLCGSAEMRE